MKVKLLMVVISACLILTSGLASAADSQYFDPASAPAISSLQNPQVAGEVHSRGENVATPIISAPAVSKQPSSTLTDAMMASGTCYANTPYNGYWNCYSSYNGSSASTSWEQTLKGVVRVDNRLSAQPSDLKYTQTTSGSTSITVTGQVAIGGEADVKTPIINFAQAKLSGQITLSGSGTWTWSNSTTIEDSWQIPAGKVGYTYSYNPGGSVSGTAYYDMYTTSDNSFIGTWGSSVGGTPPSAGSHNYKHVTADN